ncbi:hypothetical protein NQ317_018639, partial [Molorchus minor]
VAGKRDPEQEREAQEWIEQVIGQRFPPGVPYEDVLRDGIVLCNLMNRLSPGIIPKVNTSGGDYKMMDNLNQSHEPINFNYQLNNQIPQRPNTIKDLGIVFDKSMNFNAHVNVIVSSAIKKSRIIIRNCQKLEHCSLIPEGLHKIRTRRRRSLPNNRPLGQKEHCLSNQHYFRYRPYSLQTPRMEGALARPQASGREQESFLNSNSELERLSLVFKRDKTEVLPGWSELWRIQKDNLRKVRGLLNK